MLGRSILARKTLRMDGGSLVVCRLEDSAQRSSAIFTNSTVPLTVVLVSFTNEFQHGPGQYRKRQLCRHSLRLVCHLVGLHKFHRILPAQAYSYARRPTFCSGGDGCDFSSFEALSNEQYWETGYRAWRCEYQLPAELHGQCGYSRSQNDR
jgi:hypothetical protein